MDFMTGLGLGAFLAFIVLVNGCDLEFRSVLEQEAIDAGVAEYYLDAEHQRQFRWREVER